MKVDCVCPNCYRPIPVRGDRRRGWVSCVKCGHVFRLGDAVTSATPSRQTTARAVARTGRW
jgi:hypothetical protein